MLRSVAVLAIFMCVLGEAAVGRAEPLAWQRLLGQAEVLADSPRAPGALEGHPVLVTFFASWCPPCRDEFAYLNALSRETAGQGVRIVAVNVFERWGGQDNPQRMQRFLARTKPEFALVRGSTGIRAAFGGVERIPTVVVYDRAGREVWRFVHARGATKTHASLDEMRAALRQAGIDLR